MGPTIGGLTDWPCSGRLLRGGGGGLRGWVRTRQDLLIESQVQLPPAPTGAVVTCCRLRKQSKSPSTLQSESGAAIICKGQQGMGEPQPRCRKKRGSWIETLGKGKVTRGKTWRSRGCCHCHETQMVIEAHVGRRGGLQHQHMGGGPDGPTPDPAALAKAQPHTPGQQMPATATRQAQAASASAILHNVCTPPPLYKLHKSPKLTRSLRLL